MVQLFIKFSIFGRKLLRRELKPLIGYKRASGNQLFCCDDATLAWLATNDQRRQASAE